LVEPGVGPASGFRGLPQYPGPHPFPPPLLILKLFKFTAFFLISQPTTTLPIINVVVAGAGVRLVVTLLPGTGPGAGTKMLSVTRIALILKGKEFFSDMMICCLLSPPPPYLSRHRVYLRDSTNARRGTPYLCSRMTLLNRPCFTTMPFLFLLRPEIRSSWIFGLVHTLQHVLQVSPPLFPGVIPLFLCPAARVTGRAFSPGEPNQRFRLLSSFPAIRNEIRNAFSTSFFLVSYARRLIAVRRKWCLVRRPSLLAWICYLFFPPCFPAGA